METSQEVSIVDSIASWWQAFFQSIFGVLWSSSIHFQASNLTIYYDSNVANVGEGACSVVLKGSTSYGAAPEYALKKMLLQSAELERIAVTEIEAFEKFKHKNILKLVDYTRVNENGIMTAYLLFPYKHRGSLRDHMNIMASQPRNRATLVEVIRGFTSICEALQILHSSQPSYVHQDIKLENVLIGDRGEPYLIDFGSVRKAEVSIRNRKDALRVAEEAATNCTASYRAPELFDPPTGATLDTRTDVWSLGCLLFAWWFGYSPFECEFNGDAVRVVECSALRTLAGIPRPRSPTVEDKVVLELTEWILDKDFSVRPFTTDILERLRAVASNLRGPDHIV